VKRVAQEGWGKVILINNGPVPGLLTQAERVSRGTLSFFPFNYPELRSVSVLCFPYKGPGCQKRLEDFCVALLSPEEQKKQIDLRYQRSVIAVSDFLFRIHSSRYCLWFIKPDYCEDPPTLAPQSFNFHGAVN